MLEYKFMHYSIYFEIPTAMSYVNRATPVHITAQSKLKPTLLSLPNELIYMNAVLSMGHISIRTIVAAYEAQHRCMA